MRKTALLSIVFLFGMIRGASAQTTAAVLPYPNFQPLDNNGAVIPGGTVCVYAAGTSTPMNSYTDYTGGVANTNPVILDSSGRANIWLEASAKIVLSQPGTGCPSTGAQIWSVDGISAITNNPTFNSITVAHDFISEADVNGGNAFQTSMGGTYITGVGVAKFNSVTATTVFNSDADVSVSPSTTAAFQTSGGDAIIYGNGYANFQSMAIALLPSALTGASGGTGVGDALLSATTTGVYISLNGGTPTLIGSGGGGGGCTPGGIVNSIQINNGGGNCTGFAAFTYSSSTGDLVLTGSVTSGVDAPAFASSNTGTNVAFTDGTGNFTILGNGTSNFQSTAVALLSGPTTGIGGGTGVGNALLSATTSGLYYSLNGASPVLIASSSTIYCSGTGTNTITCPGVPPPGSYVDGQEVILLAGGTNTGATTLNVNSLGATSVVSGGSALTGGEIVNGNLYTLFYSASTTSFSLVPTGGGTPGSPSTSVQFNSSGVFAGNAAFEWNNSTGLLRVCASLGGICSAGTSGVESQTFNSSATGSAVAFTDTSANFTILGNGAGAFQTLNAGSSNTFQVASSGVLTLTNSTGTSLTINSSSGAAISLPSGGITLGGLLTANGGITTTSLAASSTVSGAGFTAFMASPPPIGSTAPNTVTTTLLNCTATSTTSCVKQASGTFSINGQGDFLGQSITTGAHNGSNIATQGTGAAFNKVGANFSILGYDSGGVCEIGTGIPGVSCTSDATTKTNIVTMAGGLDKVMQLRPVTYDRIANGSHSLGFIAQEVQPLMPLLVTPAPDSGLLLLNEEGMIPYLVSAIQQLEAEIKTLQATH